VVFIAAIWVEVQTVDLSGGVEQSHIGRGQCIDLGGAKLADLGRGEGANAPEVMPAIWLVGDTFQLGGSQGAERKSHPWPRSWWPRAHRSEKR